jgi:hypothetical protein
MAGVTVTLTDEETFALINFLGDMRSADPLELDRILWNSNKEDLQKLLKLRERLGELIGRDITVKLIR